MYINKKILNKNVLGAGETSGCPSEEGDAKDNTSRKSKHL